MCGISTASSARWALSSTLRRSRCLWNLSNRQSWWQTCPIMWTRLSPTAEFHLLQVQSGIEGKLFHGMQCVAFHSSLHLIRWLSQTKKYPVKHFTCSVCPTVFGPQDSYYEHENDVYCHFHYSTRFATKCAGCNSAILKQFVEINRNNRDECWHPECYMINKVNTRCRSIDGCWNSA